LNLYQTPVALYVTLEKLPQMQIAQGAVGAYDMEIKMKLSIVLSTLLVAGVMAASVEPASAVIYCSYVGYPVGCVARAGVVLRPRPVARAAVTHGTAVNRGGPVNRDGRR